jgi:hypothetical protein
MTRSRDPATAGPGPAIASCPSSSQPLLALAWRTRSLRPQKISSAPAAVRVARFGLRISRARQPSRRVRRDSSGRGEGAAPFPVARTAEAIAPAIGPHDRYRDIIRPTLHTSRHRDVADALVRPERNHALRKSDLGALAPRHREKRAPLSVGMESGRRRNVRSAVAAGGATAYCLDHECAAVPRGVAATRRRAS